MQRLHRDACRRRSTTPTARLRAADRRSAHGRPGDRSAAASSIYESTVYPGATEEVCVPILERDSGLRASGDFLPAIPPSASIRATRSTRLTTIIKVVAGDTPETLDTRRRRSTADRHGRACTRRRSIKVAEAAKVIENTQRDLNIALMNELALIFDRLGIDTLEVLEAAGTKWNFLPFRPGLVGGHCIGVDPYYLTHKAEQARLSPAR